MAVAGLWCGRRRFQRYLIGLVLLFFIVGMIQGIALLTNTDLANLFWESPSANKKLKNGELEMDNSKENPDSLAVKNSNLDGSLKEHPVHEINKQNRQQEQFSEKLKQMEVENNWPEPNYNVHVFYYPWYGNPESDGRYLHWNHRFIPHWDKDQAMKWPMGQHVPPDDIGANYYPELGPYSSRSQKVIEDHMQQIRSAGIGVLAVSWYPPAQTDQPGQSSSDDLLPLLLDAAHKYRLKVCLHVEPYKNRNHMSLRNNLVYVDKYNQHPAMYKVRQNERDLPLYYIYDSYLTSWDDWGKLFRQGGSMTVRNSDLDGIFIGLVANENHRIELMSAGFDGMYTYFASNGFTYGSSTSNWADLMKYVKQFDGYFIPSIGPGYIDTRVRPWNRKNTRHRQSGQYFEMNFRSAIETKPRIISITSFNEWHEGTQIEKAIPHHYGSFRYLDYTPNKPDHFLMLTKKWIQEFQKS